MAIKRPDIYEHNNPVLAIVDSDFLRGGGRVVADLTALYALSSNSDQLKERVTKVWVTAESAYYILIDDTNIGNSNGWEEETGGATAWGTITGTLSSQTDLQSALDAKTNKLITTNRQTASYTLVLSDADKLVEMNVATANNLTIPLNSSVAFPTGTQILLAQYGAGQTTVVATSGVTVRSNGGKLKLNVQYSGATLIKIAENEWYLFGDIVS
jgi:hypothetical protein